MARQDILYGKMNKGREERVIIVARGGLANRMRAIASAYVHAQNTSRRLVVVWSKNKDLNASFGEIFNMKDLPFDVIEPRKVKYTLLYEEPRKKNLYLSKIVRKFIGMNPYKDINLDSEQKINGRISGTAGDVIINSGLQFAEIDKGLLNTLFQFSEEVKKRKQELLKGIRPDFAVQIRRTDNKESIRHSPMSAFEKIIADELRKNRDSKFFLATDDNGVKDSLASRYPNNIIYNCKETRRDTPAGMRDGCAEFLIMSECDKIYGSYWSSFSEISALYGGKELTLVK